MRFIGLLALVILLPTFAWAAALININTADSTLLQSLSGIGPSKAAGIIEYRTQHGPFARIEDIQNVSGIGPSTYAGIKAFITVAAPTSASTSNTGSSSTASSTQSSASSAESATASTTVSVPVGTDPPEYIPIPKLRIMTGGARTISSGADTTFAALVYDSKGNKRDDALVTWAFGDGMRRSGYSVLHAYYDPGEYVVVVHATTPDGGNVTTEAIITARDASIQITSVSPRGVTLTNAGTRTLDLSLWRLSMGGQEFKIPEDTYILAGRNILFPTQVIQLPIADFASLLYPSGAVAFTYPALAAAQLEPTPAQPPVPRVSYQPIQTVEAPVVSKVEAITSTRVNIQTHEPTVIAPIATNELAAVGAVSAPSDFFHSRWTLGFLGVLTTVGAAAFILL